MEEDDKKDVDVHSAVEKENAVIDRSFLDLMNSGLLLSSMRKEIEDSAYSAIDQVTHSHRVLKSRHGYSSELIRVLDELKLTSGLLEAIDKPIKIGNKVYEPEEQINYYSGIYFGLVHQIKDKLLRLIDHMAAEDTQKSPYPEPEKISTSKLIRKHGEKISDIGITGLVEEWAQDDGPIGVILKKRTQHHHFTSKLQLNDDFQNIRLSKLMLAAPSSSHLSDYGKGYMAKLGGDSLKKLKDDVVEKQHHSIKIVEDNLNAISEKLIDYYKIPVTQEETAKVTVEYMDFLSSLKIKNEADIAKLSPEVSVMIDEFRKTADMMGDRVLSTYVVGSSVRGEFIPGSSDINMYVITRDYTQVYENEQPVTLHILSEDDFLSEAHKKDRFICWSDGVLMQGKEYKFSERDFPKPGTLLCLLLNRGIVERLERIKIEVESLSNPTTIQLRLYGLEISKMMLDYAFGVAMSNKPFYTSSRKKKIDYIKEVFPNMPLTHTLEQIYYGRPVRQQDIGALIDAYLLNARKNYAKQLALEKQVTS